MVNKSATPKKKRCICDKVALLKQITGNPPPLATSEINKIRLNLFTERHSDGSGVLVLRGRDIYEKYNRRIEDTDIRAICLYVRELPRRIEKIDLAYNEITDAGFFKLLKMILVKSRSCVINLNIMNNNLTETSVLYLSKYAYYVRLKYLRMNGNQIGTKGGEYMSYFLKINTTLEFLDIGHSNQTLTSVAPIITALRIDHGKNDTLKVLDLSRIDPLFNRYSYETKWLGYHIEYLLERNKTLIELHLQKNELIGHDMEFLVRGLRRNTTLLYLDLGFNRIGEYGAELLAEYLGEAPNLRLLNISGNSIKDSGSLVISRKMPFSKLRALDISKNKITDNGLVDILNTLRKMYRMRFFNIWGNEIGVNSCEIINRLLLSGVLQQDSFDVKLYEVDDVLYAAYYPNPSDRNKHIYYCELDYGCAQPIYHIKRNKACSKESPKIPTWQVKG